MTGAASETCDFCGGSEDAVGPLDVFAEVTICPVCTESFSHQLGHSDGACTNCGRQMPEAERLHGEGTVTICEVCLRHGPGEETEGEPDEETELEPDDQDPPDSGDEPGSSAGADDVGLTHVTDRGEVHMVDVAGKDVTDRIAVAEAVVAMTDELAERLFSGAIPKGDVLATVRLAGVMGAKRTPELIPLAHPIALTSVTVEVERHDRGVRIEATCGTTDRTGVEMEAMTGAGIAALTLYDMVKSIEREVVVERIRLVSKSGGRSGAWRAAGLVGPEATDE